MLKKKYLEVLLNKGFIVLQEKINKTEKCKLEEVAGLLNSFSSLGYTLDQEGINALCEMSSNSLTYFYNTYFAALKEISGVSVRHQVFYPNFPDVSRLSDSELYVRAMLHYLTSSEEDQGFMNSDLSDFPRIKQNSSKKKLLKLITKEEAIKFLASLVNDSIKAPVAAPCYMLDLYRSIAKDYPNLIYIEEISFKENIAFYINMLLPTCKKYKYGDVITSNTLRFVKTPTDLLRVYAVLSKGDVTLRENTKFVSLDRKCRRLFLQILDNISSRNDYSIDDFARHDFLWKKAFEKLHVGEYSSNYPHVYANAKKLRSDNYLTFYGELESLKDNQQAYIKLLKTRPGEFARRLDYLIRNVDFDFDYTLDQFYEVADKVSSTVLLQLWEYFSNRGLYKTRIFCIKKQYGNVYKEIEDERVELEDEVIDEVLSMLEGALKKKYSAYENKGKVFLDSSLKNYCLPINARNASSQNKTLTFGSRVKLEETDGNFLRLFTHFKNMDKQNKYDDGRVDVDLSVEFVNEDFTESFSLAWHDIGSGRKFNSFHSGDITSAPKGASEFIDIDYKKARNYARYAVVVNSVFTGQDFADIPECFSGAMFMEKSGKKGEIYNPEFIGTMFRLTQKGSNQNIAFAIDLETLELIWMDTPMKGGNYCVVAAANGGVVLSLKDALKKHMNLYDFFKLHSKHITLVDDKEDADIIISDSDDATLKPYDVETISAHWL